MWQRAWWTVGAPSSGSSAQTWSGDQRPPSFSRKNYRRRYARMGGSSAGHRSRTCWSTPLPASSWRTAGGTHAAERSRGRADDLQAAWGWPDGKCQVRVLPMEGGRHVGRGWESAHQGRRSGGRWGGDGPMGHQEGQQIRRRMRDLKNAAAQCNF
jgi:hypothetical protein